MEWKQIQNFPNYEISTTGLVRNMHTGKLLKPKNRLYPTVTLSNKGISKEVALHRLVASAAAAIGLANPINGGASHIKDVCEGRRKSLKGFSFAYEKEGDSHSLE